MQWRRPSWPPEQEQEQQKKPLSSSASSSLLPGSGRSQFCIDLVGTLLANTRLPADLVELLVQFVSGSVYEWVPFCQQDAKALQPPWHQLGPQPEDTYGKDHHAVAVPAIPLGQRVDVDVEILCLSSYLPCARLFIVSGGDLMGSGLSSALALAASRPGELDTDVRVPSDSLICDTTEADEDPDESAPTETLPSSPPASEHTLLGTASLLSETLNAPLAIVEWSPSGNTAKLVLRGRGKPFLGAEDSPNPFRFRLSLRVDAGKSKLCVRLEDVDQPELTAGFEGAVDLTEGDIEHGLWFVGRVTWGTAIRFCEVSHDQIPREVALAELPKEDEEVSDA